MPRIKQPEPGQVFWTAVSGQVCQRIYVRVSDDETGHILKFPDLGTIEKTEKIVR